MAAKNEPLYNDEGLSKDILLNLSGATHEDILAKIDEIYQSWDEAEEEADRNDMGDRNEEFAERANTLGELETRMYDVEQALAKIDKADGSYGKCSVCGNQIEEDRLAANPAATTCKEHM